MFRLQKEGIANDRIGKDWMTTCVGFLKRDRIVMGHAGKATERSRRK